MFSIDPSAQNLWHCLRVMAITLSLGVSANLCQAGNFLADNGDGTITDMATGLTWMRCSLPQTWDGHTCVGMANTYSWNQANSLPATSHFANKADWRLPNVRELLTLQDWSSSSSMDAVLYQSVEEHRNYWTSTPGVGAGDGPWDANFSTFQGADPYNQAGDFSSVRLVRGGADASALLRIDRPDADYTDNGNGTVTHAASGLIWQKCLAGQTWNGNACEGAASLLSWAEASNVTSTLAGKRDWRLPTVEELLTLVDYTRTAPAINDTIFPGTPATYFWTSSASASAPDDYINVVSFERGHSGTSYFRHATGPYTRLVRETRAELYLAADCVFRSLEIQYPEYLSPSGVASGRLSPYYYRYYPDSNAYVGLSITDNHLYYIGSASSGQLADLGLFSVHHGNSGCI